MLSLRCFKLEKWFFKFPLILVCTLSSHLFLWYYSSSLNNKRVCSDDSIA
jgi:hypothetical protein